MFSWATCIFDAERYSEAITWYEAAVALKPTDANLSTDLGVAYYYTNQPDRAIAQFEKSLAADPKHTKTLLNLGIVKAFGKQDLDGADEGVGAGDGTGASAVPKGKRRRRRSTGCATRIRLGSRAAPEVSSPC